MSVLNMLAKGNNNNNCFTFTMNAIYRLVYTLLGIYFYLDNIVMLFDILLTNDYCTLLRPTSHSLTTYNIT